MRFLMARNMSPQGTFQPLLPENRLHGCMTMAEPLSVALRTAS
jgi:hypothetical protein